MTAEPSGNDGGSVHASGVVGEVAPSQIGRYGQCDTQRTQGKVPAAPWVLRDEKKLGKEKFRARGTI